MTKYTGDSEYLRELDESDLDAMIEYLIEGNDPEDMAIQLLERLSHDELDAILAIQVKDEVETETKRYIVCSGETVMYNGDDPKYADDLATMLRLEEPKDVGIWVKTVYMKVE